MTNNWTPSDPILRVMRAIAIVALIALIALIVIDTDRRDVTLTFLLFGALLLTLGFPVGGRILDRWGVGPKEKRDE